MIDKDKEADVLRLFHAEKWKVGTIAAQLRLHHSTVQRVLIRDGLDPATLVSRATLADPYVPFIRETLVKYPRLRASRLYEMVKERGYAGAPDHFRTVVARYRPKPAAEAFLRLRTLPGEQAQVDWGHFGKVAVGSAMRVLWAFVMVLSYSRQIFLEFFLSAAMPSFLRGHADAFAFYGGIPRVVLYDNLKSAVLERVGDAIRFHPSLLELAAWYRFEPRPVSIARGNEKGRVERAIRYVRDNFFAARKFDSVVDLNQQAAAWMTGLSADRRWPEDKTMTVRAAFEAERPRLLPLPDNAFAADELVTVHVGKTPYVRFDLNDYSVPADYVRRTLTVSASTQTVRILNGTEVVAEHARTFDRGRQIEDAVHIAALAASKQLAAQSRGMDRLAAAVPHSRALLELAAERGFNLGSIVARLLKLLDRVPAQQLDDAVAEAVHQNSPHLGSVRQILDRHRTERGLPPPVTVRFGADTHVRNVVVRPHSLDTYDQLREPSDDSNE